MKQGQHFPQSRVSERSFALLGALESAACALGATSEDDPEAVSDAFGNLILAREVLYQYIEELEIKDRAIERTVILRF